MPVNPHSYPHEKIGNGLRSLMSFSMAPEERIQAALVELHITYGHNTPSGRALEHGNRIQVERTTAYAQRKGWTVAPEHVYQDDGISGAEFVKRPGFLRLMNALKPRPGFQVLIMNEESRLGREAIETSYALKQLIDAGVRVFTYLDDRERTLGSALDKVMLSLTNFASEMERERPAADSGRDAAEGRPRPRRRRQGLRLPERRTGGPRRARDRACPGCRRRQDLRRDRAGGAASPALPRSSTVRATRAPA